MKVWWDYGCKTEIEGRQSGALGLFHELTHFYIDITSSEEDRKKLSANDPDYDTFEEKIVIEKYETSAAKS